MLRGRPHLLAVTAFLAVLLAVLATLQYHWIGQVSALDRQRRQASLLAAGSRLAEDFDDEVTRAFLYFHFEVGEVPDDPLARAARQHERWAAEAPWPDLVRAVYAALPDGAGGLALRVLRPGTGRFEPGAWPPELAGVRRRLLAGPAGDGSFVMHPMAPDLPGLVIPFGPPGAPAHAPPPGHLILRFDTRVLAGEVLPALARRWFGGAEGHHYALAVVAADGSTVFRTGPRVPAAAWRSPDVSLDLLGLRPVEELHSLWRGHGPHRMAGMTPVHLHRPAAPPAGTPRQGGGWRLLIAHRKGSLEAAVATVRHHNLGVSLGILALLAATVGMTMVASQRAQRLARQQIELVAGVTHELNTPLTAIRSAGQNLADGVVAEPGQVRRYGALIEAEGRRLSAMVGQALELAGIESGRRTYHLQPAAVDALVEGALEDCRWLLEERGVEVERRIEPGLPPVKADAPALRRAVGNLVENAVKHGGGRVGSWVGVRARRAAEDGGGWVEITVADRGPGIRREDLPHLFEPFYRGRDAAAGSVPGSGLGLSLVRHIAQAHGGRVTVAAGGDGRGSAFTLHLPAAAPEAAA